MAKKDELTTLRNTLLERQAKKAAAISGMETALAEAEARIKDQRPGAKRALEEFDTDSYSTIMAEITSLEAYCTELRQNLREMKERPLGAAEDPFMKKLEAINAEVNEEFNAKLTEILSNLWALCKSNQETVSAIGVCADGWHADYYNYARFAPASSRTVCMDFLRRMYSNGHQICADYTPQ